MFDTSFLFGLNTAVVLSIVGLSQVIKEQLPELKNTKWYMLLPALLSLLFSFVMADPITWQGVALNSLLYFSISTLFYDTVVQYIESKKQSERERQ